MRLSSRRRRSLAACEFRCNEFRNDHVEEGLRVGDILALRCNATTLAKTLQHEQLPQTQSVVFVGHHKVAQQRTVAHGIVFKHASSSDWILTLFRFYSLPSLALAQPPWNVPVQKKTNVHLGHEIERVVSFCGRFTGAYPHVQRIKLLCMRE